MVSLNITTASGSSREPIFTNDIFKYLLFGFSFVTFIIDIFTYVAIKKTKRVPFATKLLTCVTLACDSMFLFVVLLGALLQVRASDTGDVLNAIFTEAGKLCIVVSWLAVTLLSLERVICLYFPNWYALKASKRNIIVYVAVCTLTIVLIKLVARYLILPSVRHEEFNFVNATLATLPLSVYFLGIFMVIHMLCFIATYQVVRKHSRLIERTQRSFRSRVSSRMFVSTRNITCIIIVFQLVHLPLLISLSLPLHGEKSRRTYLTVISMLVMCAVNPVLYAWRFRECRFVMVKLLLSGLACLTNREYFNDIIETKRMKVYGISGSVLSTNLNM